MTHILEKILVLTVLFLYIIVFIQ